MEIDPFIAVVIAGGAILLVFLLKRQQSSGPNYTGAAIKIGALLAA